MKRRFVIPAAMALALHALLFMGSSIPGEDTGNPITTTADKPKDPPVKPPEEVKRYYEVVLAKVDEESRTVPNPDAERGGGRGSVIDRPPGLPELPPPADWDNGKAITFEAVPVVPGGTGKLPGSWRPGTGGDGNGDPHAFVVGELDAKPRTRYEKAPRYPVEMRTAGISGTVWVDFMVDERGRVSNVRVVKSTNPAFDAVTVAAVAEWRFVPGTHRGLPVRFRMSLPVAFNLES